MALDEELADRIRDALEGADADAVERRMFGGLGFMVHGHMTVGIVGSDLMVRVGPHDYEDALAACEARPMDFTGKAMTGMVYVAAAKLDDTALQSWIRRSLRFTTSLQPK